MYVWYAVPKISLQKKSYHIIARQKKSPKGPKPEIEEEENNFCLKQHFVRLLIWTLTVQLAQINPKWEQIFSSDERHLISKTFFARMFNNGGH